MNSKAYPTKRNIEKILKNSFDLIVIKKSDKDDEYEKINALNGFIELFEWVKEILLELSKSKMIISDLKKQVGDLKNEIQKKNETVALLLVDVDSKDKIILDLKKDNISKSKDDEEKRKKNLQVEIEKEKEIEKKEIEKKEIEKNVNEKYGNEKGGD
jgi:hypothetical protein